MYEGKIIQEAVPHKYGWECSCGEREEPTHKLFSMAEDCLDAHIHEHEGATIGTRPPAPSTPEDQQTQEAHHQVPPRRDPNRDQPCDSSRSGDQRGGDRRDPTHNPSLGGRPQRDDLGTISDVPNSPARNHTQHTRPSDEGRPERAQIDTTNATSDAFIGVIEPGKHEVHLFTSRWKTFTQNELIDLRQALEKLDCTCSDHKRLLEEVDNAVND